MSDTVIRVENLSKKYIIGRQRREGYTALRDVIADGAKSFGRRVLKPLAKRMPDPAAEEFWALKDVSFEIKQGDRVGIIGRNGAGKSTLLKILSRITEPTNGRISIKGRVASLLEVGTGFHPELTGRENIYLNGAILGMSKAEIKKKFDEIVAFAEVERFLDTPVKRYSSGMYVRLAFAVAAHLEPEILVIDEVLAVGDAQFQKKCLGKMEEVGEEGRTVLFVSHNMSTVRQLCTKACLLSTGFLSYKGITSEVISKYMQEGLRTNSQQQVKDYRHIQGDGRAQVQAITVNDVADSECTIAIFESIKVSIDYVINQPINKLEFFVLIYSADGEIQASLLQRDSNTYTIPIFNKGIVTLKFKNCLMPGGYILSAGILDQSRQFVDWVEHVESFYVEPSFQDGSKYDNRLGKVSFFWLIGKAIELRYALAKKKYKRFIVTLIQLILNHIQNGFNHYLQEKNRKSLASCGERVGFQMPICIEGADKVKIGHRVSIAAFVHIWGQGGVEIGDDTLIASHVAITSLTHDPNATLFSESLISKRVIIGRNVWIGSHATILPGVRVGDGAVIGAGAVVTKDVAENTIVVGVPAQVLRNRFKDE